MEIMPDVSDRRPNAHRKINGVRKREQCSIRVKASREQQRSGAFSGLDGMKEYMSDLQAAARLKAQVGNLRGVSSRKCCTSPRESQVSVLLLIWSSAASLPVHRIIRESPISLTWHLGLVGCISRSWSTSGAARWSREPCPRICAPCFGACIRSKWQCNSVNPKHVIHHSNQGSQYTAMAFGRRCRNTEVHPSMARLVIAMAMHSVRVSSPPWNLNCSIAIPCIS